MSGQELKTCVECPYQAFLDFFLLMLFRNWSYLIVESLFSSDKLFYFPTISYNILNHLLLTTAVVKTNKQTNSRKNLQC